MHERQIIVTRVEITKSAVNFVEVVRHDRLHVFVMNFNEIVSCCVVVHMVETENVDELMHHRSPVNAAESCQRQNLLPTNPAQLRVAAIAVDNFHVVRLSGSRDEPNASFLLDLPQTSPHDDFVS